jgi:aryl-alcohol dehydrogenase
VRLQTGAGAVLVEMQLRAARTIAVFGAGAVGLAAVMAARLSGADNIVVVDLHESRLQTALELGATRVVRGDSDDVAGQVRSGGRGVDFSFETTAVGSVISTAVEVLDRRGKAVLVGAGAGMLEVVPPLLTGRTVTFALEGSAVPQLLLPELVAHWRVGASPSRS